MDQTKRLKAFERLGSHLAALSSLELETIATNARNENTWFTQESVEKSIKWIATHLTAENLSPWIAQYKEAETGKQVALILAGNIPLVGFHDILCVLISGHRALIKLSSKDQYLTKYLIEKLIAIEPGFRERITIAEQLKNFDAVIATGSDNSARYFNYYFGKYPHIIRKNRTSIAILTGQETSQEIENLAADVFTYYGLGCRNVSKVFLPAGFNFETFFPSWETYSGVVNHHKYANNYDYQKSILLINRVPFLDNGFVMLQESDKIVSPISVVYYEYYTSDAELKDKIAATKDKIQVIVGKTELCSVAFGAAQCPQLSDYADNADTMKFLASLN
jgi:hypothetical protein